MGRWIDEGAQSPWSAQAGQGEGNIVQRAGGLVRAQQIDQQAGD